jgi:hypothetical protein
MDGTHIQNRPGSIILGIGDHVVAIGQHGNGGANMAAVRWDGETDLFGRRDWEKKRTSAKQGHNKWMYFHREYWVTGV